MTVERQNLSEYLNGTRLIVLATTNGDEAPGLRVLGGFGVEGNTVFFSTAPGSEKATQLKQNENVSVLFQHENQEQASFANVTLKGKAKILEEKEEVEQAIEFIGRRNPRFKERVQSGGFANNVIFRVEAQEIKILDFGRGYGPGNPEIIQL